MEIDPRLVPGRIVRVNIPDSLGNATHDHPAVILSSAEDIARGDPIFVAAISTRRDLSPKEQQVWLPSNRGPGGHSLTKLTRNCAVICNWVVRIKASDILEFKGIVPAYAMNLIEEKVRKLKKSASSPPPSPPPDEL